MPGSLAFHESTPGKTILQEAINNSNVTVEDVFGNIIAMFDSDASDTKRNKSDRQYYLVFHNGTSNIGGTDSARITVEGPNSDIGFELAPKGSGSVVSINGTTFASTGGSSSMNLSSIYVDNIYENTTGHHIVAHNVFEITDTTASSSTSTGSFTVAGGAGVAGDLYVGNNARAKYFFSDYLTSTSGDVRIRGSNSSASDTVYFSPGYTYPALAVSSSSSNVTLTGYAKDSSSTVAPISVGSAVTISDTTNSSSSTTGALQVVGGTGIGGDLYVGGTIYGTVDASSSASTMQTLTLTGTTNSTSTSTGTLIVDGGTGIAKDVNIAGYVTITGDSGTNGNHNSLVIDSSWDTTNTMIIRGGSTSSWLVFGSVNGNASIRGTNSGQTADTPVYFGSTTSGSGVVLVAPSSVTDTTNSTSTSTGSLTVAGGVGIASDLYVGGVAHADTLATTTATAITLDNPITATLTDSVALNITGLQLDGQCLLTGGSGVSGDGTWQVWVARSNVASSDSNYDYSLVGGILSGQPTFGAHNRALTAWSNIQLSGTNILLRAQTSGGGVVVSNSVGAVNSTSSTTGALQVQGGAGVTQDLYVGGIMSVTKAQIWPSGGNGIEAGQDPNDSTSGAIWASNGTSQVPMHLQWPASGTNNVVVVQGTQGSTSSTTGSLQVKGGAGVVENLYVGGTINGNITGTGASSLATLTLSGTTGSTSTTTGTFVCDGGAGVAQNLYVGGNVDITSTVAATSYSSGGALTVAGGAQIGGDLYVTGTLNSSVPTTLVQLTLTSTAPSTSTATGSLVAGGGAGVAGDLHVGGTIYGTLSGTVNTQVGGAAAAGTNVGTVGALNSTWTQTGKTVTMNFQIANVNPSATGLSEVTFTLPVATSSTYPGKVGLGSGLVEYSLNQFDHAFVLGTPGSTTGQVWWTSSNINQGQTIECCATYVVD